MTHHHALFTHNHKVAFPDLSKGGAPGLLYRIDNNQEIHFDVIDGDPFIRKPDLGRVIGGGIEFPGDIPVGSGGRNGPIPREAGGHQAGGVPKGWTAAFPYRGL